MTRTPPAPVQVLVMAKEPRSGAVKTRLCPPLTHRQAAAVAAAALADTLEAVAEARVARRVVVLDGAPGAWLPAGVDVLAQRTGAFGARLAGAMTDAWARCPLPSLVIGMDTPQVDAALLERAAAALCAPGVDAVLGPADDGGYWVVGTRRPVPGLFDGVPMSTARTGDAQRGRLEQLGLAWAPLPGLRDVDEVADARAVADAAPGTRFAAALRAALDGAPADRPLVGGRRG